MAAATPAPRAANRPRNGHVVRAGGMASFGLGLVVAFTSTMFSFTDGTICPGDPDWHIFQHHCYFWNTTLTVTWEKALSFCRAYRGTELLYLDTVDEKDWLATEISGVYWTGLNDRDTESDFQWTTNAPLNASLIPYLRNDLQNGDLKDCVQLDTSSGLLTDIQCTVQNNFVCKSEKDMDWFLKKNKMGLTVTPTRVDPSETDLVTAKSACLQRGTACTGILETGTPKVFYILDASAKFVVNPHSSVYIPKVCASEFPGPKCGIEDQLCNCIGIVQTSFSEVCGIPVQACKNYCAKKKDGTDCSKCVPVCPDNAEEVLTIEEAAIIMMAKERIFGGASTLTVNDQDDLDGFKVFYKVE